MGIAMHNLGHYRESLLSFLKALNLDADHNHVDVLTNNIATIASQITPMPDKLMDKIPEMDAYKKLTEIGCCLYQGKKYDVCIKVLNSAQKLETNQKGITMRVQLTLANAHAALKHNELAVSLYQASNNETSIFVAACIYTSIVVFLKVHVYSIHGPVIFVLLAHDSCLFVVGCACRSVCRRH